MGESLQNINMAFIKKSNITIGCWNVEGLRTRYGSSTLSKLEFNDFKEYLTEDILCLLETHAKQDDRIELKGYNSVSINRAKNSKYGRFSGGIAIMIREELKHRVEIIKSNETEHVWVRLIKANIETQGDIFVCFAYLSPINSVYNSQEDVISKIMADVTRYNQKGKCIVVGDLNGYTNKEPDFIMHDDVNVNINTVPLPGDYTPDANLGSRENRDSHLVNRRGQEILDLCISSNLRILNGRTLGDRAGKYTCYSQRGDAPSVIDYGLADTTLLKNINTFNVCNFTPFSDHCKITINMVILMTRHKNRRRAGDKLSPIPDRFVWSDECSPRYCEALQRQRDKLEGISKYDYSNNEEGINKAVLDLENILKEASREAQVKCRQSRRRKVRKKVYPKAVDNECFKLIREMKRMARKISIDSNNRELRQAFYSTRRLLKRTIKMNERQARGKIMRELELLHDKNPEAYWKALKALEDLTKVPSKNDPSSNIDSEEWVKHFSELMNKPDLKRESESIQETLDKLKEMPTFCTLDYRITKEEIEQVLKKVKNNKSSGPEMIKKGKQALLEPMVTIFNKIFILGYFPKTWSISMIKPLYKGKGSKMDPSKYRGVSLMSCMGKVFCSVMNNRLVKHLEERNEFQKEQIAFRKGYRTSDHIMVLQTIVHKYIQKFKTGGRGVKYLYTAFVDFRKAYDSVWREGLYYKMATSGINGTFLNIVESIYENYRIQIKIQDGLTENISTNVGVKQGCVLSPTLFNFYINDLAGIFKDEDCKPITLYNEKLNCLMYADDLILLSESKEGLQNCLNELQKYCKTWKLNVNIDKTKIIIFNKNGKLMNNTSFYYENTKLENVRQYCYLGVIFQCSGSVKGAIQLLKDKANKAKFKLLSTFNGYMTDCKIGVHLFDHMIRPILLYSSGTWGAQIADYSKLLNPRDPGKTNAYFSKFVNETVQTKFMKGLIGVHNKASNIATYAELGVLPLAIEISVNIVKFWLHMLDAKTDSLLYDCYQFQIAEINRNKCWLSSVRDILIAMGYEEFWYQQAVPNKNSFIKNLQTKLRDMFIKKVNDDMNCDNGPEGRNKLRTYRIIKSEYKMESYLTDIRKRDMRANISKLRISAHDLHIERGRYHRPYKTPVEERKCRFCVNDSIEDEKHVILDCPKYKGDRETLFNKLETLGDNLSELDEMGKFKHIMRCNTRQHAYALAEFLSRVKNIRGNL